MRTLRWLAVAALAAALLVTPAAADGPQSVDYTCNETNADNQLVPSLGASISVAGTDSVDPARVYQPVTWEADIELPDIQPPVRILLNYLRVRIPIPDGVAAVSATAVAATGETPNPALSNMTVTTTADEVVLALPASPAAGNWILAKPASEGGGLTYPASFVGDGTPVVPPVLRITGVPTQPASTISWSAPEIDTELTYLGDLDTVTCAPDADPDPVIVSTTVGTGVQTCDGQAVTVQLGHNAPTAGNDVIQGTAGNDTVLALGGNDRFCGLNGNDRFRGGNGNDRARGGNGNDTLQGDAGADNLAGEAGNDTLNGGTQRDVCAGAAGRDTGTACEVRTSIP